MSMTVCKFGGTSLADGNNIRRAADIPRSPPPYPLLLYAARPSRDSILSPATQDAERIKMLIKRRAGKTDFQSYGQSITVKKATA